METQRTQSPGPSSRNVKHRSPAHGQFAMPECKNVLVCGGAGFIGSHTCVVLLEAGYKIVVVDNLVNSCEESLVRVRKITNCDPDALVFHQANVCDPEALREIFAQNSDFVACIHFAGLKAVGESVREPLLYYENNLMSTLVLLKELSKTTCRNFVFSSSATVYGNAESPITEASTVGTGVTNPYGRTKYFLEEILHDFSRSPGGSDWSIECLRYFNPTGAHPSGLIGEDPNGPPNNLMPYVSQVAVGKRDALTVFGSDYDTHDGTGVRDYIHVMDLAEGHLKALEFLARSPPGWFTHNLGTGRGYSVLEMVAAMEKASNRKIPVKIGPRRQGDVGTVYADPALAIAELHWSASRGLEEMVKDLWAWQSSNPNGFKGAN